MNKNTMKTFVLLAAFGGAFVLIGSYFGPGWATMGLVMGLAMAAGSYWFSDKLAIAASRAKRVSEAEAPVLYRIVRELTLSANMPMPALYVTPDDQPNAFATGRNPNHSSVAVTRGLLHLLDEYELRGVIAHELAHIRNRDILIGSVAAAIGMAITFLARMAFWGAAFGGSDDEEGGGIGLILMAFLAPIAALIIQMAVSRAREFEADRVGARMSGGGEGLARALEKLHAGAQRIPMHVNPAMEQAFIVNPFSGGRRPGFATLFMTHPPVEERIARLRSPRIF